METNIYNWIKKLILFGSLLGFIVFFAPMSYKLFGSLCWSLLILIVFVRPLNDILPDIKWLKKIVWMRKELGIMCATFGIAHWVWYFLAHNVSFVWWFFSLEYWDLSTGFGWGMLALAISIPLLLTSNVYSMRLFKKNWKNIQRFTYLFFIFSAVHIAIIKPNDTTSSVILVVLWAILRILAYKNIKFEFKNKNISYIMLTLIFLWVWFGMFYNWNEEHPEPEQISVSSTTQSSANSSSWNNTTLISQNTDSKIYISDRCVWCWRCARIASAYFKMQSHKAQVIKQDNVDSSVVENAVNACPVWAISIS